MAPSKSQNHDEPPAVQAPTARSGERASCSGDDRDEPPAVVLTGDDGVEVHARDETSQLQTLDVARWAELAAAVLRDEGAGAGELGLRFVDPEPMAALNLAHMGAPGPTDVLAFPIDFGDGDGDGDCDGDGNGDGPALPRLHGDVVVCPSYAAAQAPGDPVDELALLVVHGVLHVLGYDHAVETDAAVMGARERRLLAAYHGSGG